MGSNISNYPTTENKKKQFEVDLFITEERARISFSSFSNHINVLKGCASKDEQQKGTRQSLCFKYNTIRTQTLG